MNRKLTSFFLAFCLFSSLLLGQKLPRTDAEKAGMSSERLARIGNVMQQYIDQGKLAGVVTIVVRNGGVVYAKNLGQARCRERHADAGGRHLPDRALSRRR